MNTEFILYVGSVKFNIDLTGDVNIPLTFNIDDIFKVSDRKTTFSKTFNLPASRNNNEAFNHIYNINTLSSFDPNTETRALIRTDGIIVFDGVLCLDDVYIKGNGQPIYYSITLIGTIFNITTRLLGMTVKDLDFSEYDHDFKIERIYGSWFNDITINGTPGQPNKTTTYTSPAVTSETATVVDGLNRIKLTFAAAHTFAVDDEVYVDADYVTPPVAILQYAFDQQVLSVPSNTEIILKAYRPTAPYSGTFVTTVKKQQLDGIGYWYPCVNYGTYIQNFYPRLHLSGGTGKVQAGVTYIIKIYNSGPPDDFTNVGATSNVQGEIFTASAPATITGGALVIGTEYVISVYAAGDDFSNVGGPIASAVGNQWNGFVFTASGTTPTTWTGGTQIDQTGLGGYSPTIWAFGGGNSVLIALSAGSTLQSKWGDDISLTDGSTDQYWEAKDFIPHIFLREILFKTFEFLGYTWDCALLDSKFFRCLIMPLQQSFNVAEGAAITINDWLPDIKLSDILSTVINMLNLSMIPDRNNKLVIKLENRGDFFENTEIDWTDKLDESQGLRIQMMNRNFPKIYNFTNKESTDFFNTDFKNDWGSIYGDYLFDTASDFLKSESKTELLFEPSVLGGSTVLPGATTMLMATSYDADLETGANIKRKISNRLLIAGMRHLDSVFNLVSYTDPGDNVVDIPFYPYAGHIDNVFQPHPTWDINWGKPPGIYFTPSSAAFPTIVTDSDWDENALYKKNWRKYINQITHSNARIATGVFKLSPIDIYELDFSVPIRVGEYILRRNKITDWNINSDGLCSVESLTRVI